MEATLITSVSFGNTLIVGSGGNWLGRESGARYIGAGITRTCTGYLGVLVGF